MKWVTSTWTTNCSDNQLLCTNTYLHWGNKNSQKTCLVSQYKSPDIPDRLEKRWRQSKSWVNAQIEFHSSADETSFRRLTGYGGIGLTWNTLA